MKEIKKGKYKHFKGGIYEVIGVAKYSEDPDQEFVTYFHPEDNGNNELWVRPKEMFLEEVEVDGKKMPRFEFVGE